MVLILCGVAIEEAAPAWLKPPDSFPVLESVLLGQILLPPLLPLPAPPELPPELLISVAAFCAPSMIAVAAELGP